MKYNVDQELQQTLHRVRLQWLRLVCSGSQITTFLRLGHNLLDKLLNFQVFVKVEFFSFFYLYILWSL